MSKALRGKHLNISRFFCFGLGFVAVVLSVQSNLRLLPQFPKYLEIEMCNHDQCLASFIATVCVCMLYVHVSARGQCWAPPQLPFTLGFETGSLPGLVC